MKLRRRIKDLIAVAVTLVLVIPYAWADENTLHDSARSSPEWLRSGTIYEIFPRDFSQKGNLNGVTAKLGELQNLGVTILWTMPIHPIGQKFRKGQYGSPYSIRDYYAVNPDYGSINDYKRLVSEAHKRGLKVIMDLVADHTAWDSVMMNHPKFYKHDAQGKIISPVPAWTDVAALDYTNPALREYMIAMLQYWIRTCDVDGFRCDAAAMVPTDFWIQARAALTQLKPNIILLAEASQPDLLTNAFDIDYSWPLLTTLNDVLMHGAPASDIRRSWKKSNAQFPQGALHLRISDDHDESRAVARYGLNGALAASALIFTLDGVPLLYNGMEVGSTNESAGGALFEKLPISWSPKNRSPLRDIYRKLIQLRHQYKALRISPVKWLHNSDEARLLTFERADDKDDLLIAINFSNQPLQGRVDLKSMDKFKPVAIADMKNSDNRPLPDIQLNGFEWRIYHRSSELLPAMADHSDGQN